MSTKDVSIKIVCLPTRFSGLDTMVRDAFFKRKKFQSTYLGLFVDFFDFFRCLSFDYSAVFMLMMIAIGKSSFVHRHR